MCGEAPEVRAPPEPDGGTTSEKATCTLAKSTRLRSLSIWLIWDVFCSTARAAWARWLRDVYLRRVWAKALTTPTCEKAARSQGPPLGGALPGSLQGGSEMALLPQQAEESGQWTADSRHAAGGPETTAEQRGQLLESLCVWEPQAPGRPWARHLGVAWGADSQQQPGNRHAHPGPRATQTNATQGRVGQRPLHPTAVLEMPPKAT